MSAAALHSAKLMAALGAQFPGIDVALLQGVLGKFFWTWYHDHQGDTIFKRTILVFKVTVKVRDAYVLFTLLFGFPPARVG